METLSSPKATPALRRSALIELGLGVAWLVGIAATLQVVDVMLGQSPIAAALAGAVLVDVICAKAGVRWDSDERRPAEKAAARVVAGIGLAVVLSAVTLGLAVALGSARVAVGHPSTSLITAAIRAAALGVRSELLFRGIPLMAAARAGVPEPYARGFAALTGASAIALLPGVSPAAIALFAGTGLLFATLWRSDRGAWGAVGAHSALFFITGSLTRGGLLEVTWAHGNFTLGAKAASTPAWLAAGLGVALALALPKLPGFRSARQEH